MSASRLGPHSLNYKTFELLAYFLKCPIETKDVQGFHEIKLKDNMFIICPTSKDVASDDINAGVPYLSNTLEAIQKKIKPNSKTIALIPYFLCGNWKLAGFSIPRAHVILLEVNYAERKIIAHDSQDPYRWFFYPDKLNEIAREKNFKYEQMNYNTYFTQAILDFNSCGWHVLFSMAFILAGRRECLKTLKLDIASLPKIHDSYYPYLDKLLAKELKNLDLALLEEAEIKEHNDFNRELKAADFYLLEETEAEENQSYCSKKDEVSEPEPETEEEEHMLLQENDTTLKLSDKFFVPGNVCSFFFGKQTNDISPQIEALNSKTQFKTTKVK